MRELKGKMMATMMKRTAVLAAWSMAMAAAAIATNANAQSQVPAPGADSNPLSGQVAIPASIPVSQIPTGPVAGQPAAAVAQPPLALPPLPQGPGTKVDVNRVMGDVFGLTPNEIRQLRRQADEHQRAAAEAPSTPPKPVTTSVVASLAPGATPPVVRLAPGFATSIVVTDSTGSPWPIQNFVIGNASSMDVKRPVERDPEGSALSIVPKGYYSQSNLVLYLKGLATPVSMTFITGQKQVDYRVDLRVLGSGPNARIPQSAGMPSGTNSQLLSLLEGVAPEGAKPLRVSDPAAQAWMTKTGHVLLRTNLQIISPAWIGSVRSADGTSAYEMTAVSSILCLRDGQITSVSLQGW